MKMFALKQIRFSPLKMGVHVVAWSLLGWIAWELFINPVNINPIQAATQLSGKIAVIFLTTTLLCTPLNTLFGYRQALKVRRTLGLFTFMFASVHFMIFSVVDYGLDWSLLRLELTEKRFIFLGASALTLLSALAITSFKFWMKKLGKNWKRLHRLIYLIAGLVLFHYAWAKKGDIFSLQGDILGPLAFGIIVSLLLILRIPAVRRGITNLRGTIKRRTVTNPSANQPAQSSANATIEAFRTE